MTPLLAQFLSESRDLLEEAQRGLMALERDPGNAESLGAVFRTVHTIKGSSGMFPYAPLTRALHAGEDLLSALRERALPLTPALCDLLLECVDRAGAWLGEIADTGALSEEAGAQALEFAGRLRALLPGSRTGPGAGQAPSGPPEQRCTAADLPPALRSAAAQLPDEGEVLFIRYTPDPRCFFAGEDPLHLVRLVPNLIALDVSSSGLASLPELDPFCCALSFALLAAAPRREIEHIFQYVAEQIEVRWLDRRAGRTGDRGGAAAPPGGADAAAMTPQLRWSDQARTVLKVDQSKIELFMNLVGELVVAKNSLHYLARRAELHYGVPRLAIEVKEQYAVLHRIAESMQGAVMQLRMLPMSFVFERFTRLVRDLSRRLGKEVELTVEGGDTDADKGVVDRIGDPLLHLVRNSIDHGIEPPAARVAAGKSPVGAVRLRALREGDRLFIEVSDDGRGIDVEAVRRKALERGLLSEARLHALSDQEAQELIFAPGFSTAAEVSDVSGRGVGMDVVRRDVGALGGEVGLESRPGTGTTVRLSLPISMTITRVLLVSVAGEMFGVPLESVVAAVRVQRAAIRGIKRSEVFVFRERLIPLLWLSRLLGLVEEAGAGSDVGVAVLIVRVQDVEVGLAVDAFQEDMDIILKPFSGVIAGCRGYLGTAILGDGRALLVLNLREVLSWRYDTQTGASS